MGNKSNSSITIFYFSGTGNARNVANWIKNIAENENVNTEILNISEHRIVKKTESPTIGFISPTHGFNYPPIMFHFLFRFPKGKGEKVFLMNTRAGMKMGKFFIPGLSGMALYFAALLLWLKGYKIIALKPIDLPSNWISLHPGLKQKVVDSLFARRKAETERFAHKLVSGKTDFRALREIVQDLIITPIALLYYFVGRFVLAKTFIASSKCNNCNLCISKCPVKAIKTIDKRPFWTYKCESCMQCMNNCPEKAIETAHGFLALSIVVSSSVLLNYFYQYFEINKFLTDSFPSYIANSIIFIFDNLVFVAVLFAAYRLNHFLLRFSIYEKLVVYSSLTKYKFWRRYKVKKTLP